MNPFSYDPFGEGYRVIASDTGHPVSFRLYETAQQANGAAQRLNQAAADPKALRMALGALDGPPPREYVGGRRRG